MNSNCPTVEKEDSGKKIENLNFGRYHLLTVYQKKKRMNRIHDETISFILTTFRGRFERIKVNIKQ